MKNSLLLSSVTLALVAAPLLVRADANPDFDDDATPILRVQPGLVEYIHHHFEVKDTGTAKYPGDDDHRPLPPYIFRARPLGSHGPFNLRLLIQPGPPRRILNVVDITRVHLSAPGEAPSAPVPPAPPVVAEQPPTPPAPPTYQSPTLSEGDEKPMPPSTPSAPQPPATPSEPTADTPSGPILAPGTSSSNAPSLAPPPDPAPPAQ
jgi:hypothetical protein